MNNYPFFLGTEFICTRKKPAGLIRDQLSAERNIYSRGNYDGIKFAKKKFTRVCIIIFNPKY